MEYTHTFLMNKKKVDLAHMILAELLPKIQELELRIKLLKGE